MYEIFVVVVRYLLVAVATYFASVGVFDDTLIDPLASLGLVIFTGGWALYDRWWNPVQKRRRKKYTDPNREFNGGFDEGW